MILKKYSIWKAGIRNNNYPSVNKNITTDVLIIGGGITGLSTLYHLRKSKLKVCLVEKNKLGMGVTSGTTGKLTYLQELIYSKLSKEYSFDVAKSYLNSQMDAINLVNNIVKENNINCNFTLQKSHIFACTEEEIEKLKEEKELLMKMGVNVEDNSNIPVNSKYTISVSDTYYFHPVKYVNALANICSKNIYENSNVTNLTKVDDGYKCSCNGYTITAKKVVLACHYPFFLFPFFFPLKGSLERSYVSASLVNENNNISGINTTKDTISFRYHHDNTKNYFIYLNGSHNMAVKYDTFTNFNNLLYDLTNMDLKPEYIWSNKDIMTNDYLPYIGYIDDNLLLGTGYNTWGMTNGSLAGKILSDLILGKENKYTELFNPKRVTACTDMISVAKDIFSSAKPFIDTKVNKNKTFYSSQIKFTKRNGKDIAIYIDENKKEHIVYNKCPHLKCSLIFNEVEKTWDCPCHASRFDLDGKCIEGPSCYDISCKD